MQKYNIPYIPYDKNLVSRARELRRAITPAESLFWDEVLKHEKFSDFKFTRQKPLDCFIVDFYCASLGLAIEIDGKVHDFQKVRDQERDNLLREKFEIKVIRYTNEEILNNTGKVIEDLIKKITYLTQTPP